MSENIHLTEYGLERLANSLTNLNLSLLKKISKDNLMQIILLREVMLNNLMNEYQENLKAKDKFLFKSLRNEIDDLKSQLYERRFYAEYKEIKEELNKVLADNEFKDNKIKSLSVTLEALKC